MTGVRYVDDERAVGSDAGERRGLTSVGEVAFILDRARLAFLEVLVGDLGKLNHRVVFLSLLLRKQVPRRVSRARRNRVPEGYAGGAQLSASAADAAGRVVRLVRLRAGGGGGCVGGCCGLMGEAAASLGRGDESCQAHCEKFPQWTGVRSGLPRLN